MTSVLKVTRLSRNSPVTTIKLEGQLLEPWVAVVRDVCARRGHLSKRLSLDLTAVTYADAAGTQLLHDLVREGVEIAECSNFIRELIHRTHR
jgi:anti-anti-sigma regulatory factor